MHTVELAVALHACALGHAARGSLCNICLSWCALAAVPPQVSKVLMQLASATIDAPPLLPLASGSATAATSSVARRAMHDTALWRAAEVSSETGQVGRVEVLLGSGWPASAFGAGKGLPFCSLRPPPSIELS